MSILKKLEDSFVVAEIIKSFEISDYYTRVYSKKEIENISFFLDYIELVEGVRLPLIPMIDLYKIYTTINFDCTDCIFSREHVEDFLKTLKDWLEETNN
jgi:hypothetical protein